MKINIVCKRYYFLKCVFIQHAWYKIVFVLRRELVAMVSRVQIITGVLGFREQLPQSMSRVGCDGPKQSLVCIIGHVGEGLGNGHPPGGNLPCAAGVV